MPIPSVVAIVPAAGQSSRFGSMKLLEDVDGVRLVDRTIGCLLDAGLAKVILVAAAREALASACRVTDSRVMTVVNPDPSLGMFSSIQAGLSVAEAEIVLVLPADMPFVQPETVSAVIEAARARGGLIVPVHAGRRGHPIAIPCALARALRAENPTSSLKAALTARRPTVWELPVDDPGILRDVDVPGDLVESWTGR